MTTHTEDDLELISDIGEAIAAGMALGAQAADPVDIDENIAVLLVPPGFTAQEFDRRALRGDTPLWVAARRSFEDTASLIGYLHLHNPTKPVVYIDQLNCKATAILDDHTGAATNRTAHHALLNLTKTEAWETWAKVSGTLLDQTAFAELVEDRIGDIGSPSGADLLEIAQSFHAQGSAQFRSDQRLSNGNVRLNYVEETTATAGKDGSLEVPQTITLVIAPFEGAEPKAIVARLRYRLSGGKLRIGVILNDPNGFIRTSVAEEFAKISAAVPNAVLLNGKP